MPDVITISTKKPPNPAFDYEELRKLGIEHIEKTASAIWSDYNIHDPGITTLELLCYAITELSYRSAYSIPDLLATETDTVKNIQEHFISAARIFPNKPVTLNDYRKLLIDIEGVKNAWLKKTTTQIFADQFLQKLFHEQPADHKWQLVNVKGYYDILIEFDTNIEEGAREEIKLKAKEVLMANRNLCEDFVNVGEVNKEFFRLCSEIEIAANADPFDTLAMIFFNIQVYLTPLVNFYWLKELFDQKYTSDKIFEGPLLTHGFIKDEEMIQSELKTEVYLSDIMQKMLQVEGVINILDIVFNSVAQTNELPNKWIIDVTDGSQPFVDVLLSKVVLYKDGMPFRPDMNMVKLRFDKLMLDHTTGNDLVRTEDISYETGSFSNAGKYYSIQNHYPKNYGISHWGLPPEASAERKMQVKQLQGYLYFFDQHLANYLSQLSHTRNLFSLDDETHTLFTQLANNFKGFDNPNDADKDAADLFVSPLNVADNIQASAETAVTSNKRRNIFLDHLLSRFAESFFDYVNILQTAFPGMNNKELIDTKISFLKGYPEYSSQRFMAYNYTLDDKLWDTDNTSGLEKRLQRLLGFKNINRRSLVNYYTVIQQALNESAVMEFWFEIIDNQTGNVLLRGRERFLSREDTVSELEVSLMLVTNIANYNVRNNESDFVIELKDKTDKVVAEGSEIFTTQELASAGIMNLIQRLTSARSEEGMFLVEHLLLLPVKRPIGTESGDEVIEDGKAFMPICVDQNCDDCDETDPYSFRLSIVLPAYANRFLNMDFRRYCERIIRMETPSHLFPKICWVNNEQLQEFEKAYKAWLEVKAGMTEDPDTAILERFINILTSLKTVYPPAMLEDCKNTEERKLFLLNQNALGTLKS